MKTIFLTALAPVLWGTTYIVTTELIPIDRPLTVAALRALPVGLLFLLVYRKLPKGIWWWRIAVLGSLNIGLFFGFLFIATYRIPGGVVATTGAIQPLLVILLSWLMLNQRPLPIALFASFLGIVGVAMLVLDPSATLDFWGIISALIAAVIMASGLVLMKKWGRPVALLLFTGWQLVSGGVVLLVLAMIFEGPLPDLSLTNVSGIFWLAGLNTGLAYVLWFWGVERLDQRKVAFLTLLSPMVAILIGFMVLGQSMKIIQIIGVILILFSLILAQSNRIKTKPANPAKTKTRKTNRTWQSQPYPRIRYPKSDLC